MTAYFNKDLGLVEILHNGRVVDTSPGMSDAFMKIGFFEKLLCLRLSSVITQDEGKNHIGYIKMLAHEICWWENGKSTGKSRSWNDCIKLALRLHVANINRLPRSLTK